MPCRLDALVKRPLCPSGGNDCIFTPDDLALQIVEHFKPSGRICEPCKGDGAFLRAMPGADWFEIAEGKDFMLANGEWDWIITNPPWSKIRPFLNKSMEMSNNIVFLCLVNAFWMKARQRDIKEHGFGIVEIMIVETPKNWQSTGFSLGAVWIRKGWTGGVHIFYA